MEHLATPLHLAAEKGHLKVVQLLVESGAKCDLTTKDGRTALDVAVDYGHVEIVRFLSELGEGAEKPCWSLRNTSWFQDFPVFR